MNSPDQSRPLEKAFSDFKEVVENHPKETVTSPDTKANVYILFHADCDGYAAGAIAFNTMSCKERNFQTIPVQYGQPFPDLDLKRQDEVYVLDFSYSREILDKVYQQVSKLVVLDHHETAREQLEGLPYAHFDMTKSGVLLAWEYFVPEYPASEAVMWLDTYDLWRKNDPKYPWNQVVTFHMACNQHLKDFAFWTALMNGYHIDSNLWSAGQELYLRFSEAVEEVKISPLTEVVTIHNKRFGFFFAEDQISLLCDAMNTDTTLALDAVVCCMNKKEGRWTVSLRAPSHNDFYVHEIAKAFGGGGHKKAAGFKLKNNLLADEMVSELVTLFKAISF